MNISAAQRREVFRPAILQLRELYSDVDWFETQSGKEVHVLTPDVNVVDLNDIARSLGMQCRYAGHCSEFYSIGQHSILMSKVVPEQFALEALMHDATETYLQDMIGPIKCLFPMYKELELMWWEEAIAPKFGLSKVMSKEVKEADTRMLRTERDLLSFKKRKWCPEIENATPYTSKECNLRFPLMTPESAAEYFLERAQDLGVVP